MYNFTGNFYGFYDFLSVSIPRSIFKNHNNQIYFEKKNKEEKNIINDI